MVVEIELIPVGEPNVSDDNEEQVLFPARILVNGKPVEPLRSQQDWFLVKTEDWYLYLAWGSRLTQRKRGT
jgi:hypothetical protein